MRKNMVRTVICIVAVMSLLSCAGGPKFSVVQPKLVSDNPVDGRIFFYRPSAFGAALQPDVILNGQVVGKAVSHGFFFVDRPAGNYEAATSTEVERKVSFVLEKGQTRYIRMSLSPGFFVGHVYGELVEPSVALEELKECSTIEEGK